MKLNWKTIVATVLQIILAALTGAGTATVMAQAQKPTEQVVTNSNQAFAEDESPLEINLYEK